MAKKSFSKEQQVFLDRMFSRQLQAVVDYQAAWYTDEGIEFWLDRYVAGQEYVGCEPRLAVRSNEQHNNDYMLPLQQQYADFLKRRSEDIAAGKSVARRVLLPVNCDNNHWTMLSILFQSTHPADVEEIFYFDSLHQDIPDALRKVLLDTHPSVNLQTSEQTMLARIVRPEHKVKIRQRMQLDSSSCGDYMLYFAFSIIQHQDREINYFELLSNLDSLNIKDIRATQIQEMLCVASKNTDFEVKDTAGSTAGISSFGEINTDIVELDVDKQFAEQSAEKIKSLGASSRLEDEATQEENSAQFMGVMQKLGVQKDYPIFELAVKKIKDGDYDFLAAFLDSSQIYHAAVFEYTSRLHVDNANQYEQSITSILGEKQRLAAWQHQQRQTILDAANEQNKQILEKLIIPVNAVGEDPDDGLLFVAMREKQYDIVLLLLSYGAQFQLNRQVVSLILREQSIAGLVTVGAHKESLPVYACKSLRPELAWYLLAQGYPVYNKFKKSHSIFEISESELAILVDSFIAKKDDQESYDSSFSCYRLLAMNKLIPVLLQLERFGDVERLMEELSEQSAFLDGQVFLIEKKQALFCKMAEEKIFDVSELNAVADKLIKYVQTSDWKERLQINVYLEHMSDSPVKSAGLMILEAWRAASYGEKNITPSYRADLLRYRYGIDYLEYLLGDVYKYLFDLGVMQESKKVCVLAKQLYPFIYANRSPFPVIGAFPDVFIGELPKLTKDYMQRVEDCYKRDLERGLMDVDVFLRQHQDNELIRALLPHIKGLVSQSELNNTYVHNHVVCMLLGGVNGPDCYYKKIYLDGDKVVIVLSANWWSLVVPGVSENRKESADWHSDSIFLRANSVVELSLNYKKQPQVQYSGFVFTAYSPKIKAELDKSMPRISNRDQKLLPESKFENIILSQFEADDDRLAQVMRNYFEQRVESFTVDNILLLYRELSGYARRIFLRELYGIVFNAELKGEVIYQLACCEYDLRRIEKLPDAMAHMPIEDFCRGLPYHFVYFYVRILTANEYDGEKADFNLGIRILECAWQELLQQLFLEGEVLSDGESLERINSEQPVAIIDGVARKLSSRAASWIFTPTARLRDKCRGNHRLLPLSTLSDFAVGDNVLPQIMLKFFPRAPLLSYFTSDLFERLFGPGVFTKTNVMHLVYKQQHYAVEVMPFVIGRTLDQLDDDEARNIYDPLYAANVIFDLLIGQNDVSLKNVIINKGVHRIDYSGILYDQPIQRVKERELIIKNCLFLFPQMGEAGCLSKGLINHLCRIDVFDYIDAALVATAAKQDRITNAPVILAKVDVLDAQDRESNEQLRLNLAAVKQSFEMKQILKFFSEHDCCLVAPLGPELRLFVDRFQRAVNYLRTIYSAKQNLLIVNPTLLDIMRVTTRTLVSFYARDRLPAGTILEQFTAITSGSYLTRMQSIYSRYANAGKLSKASDPALVLNQLGSLVSFSNARDNLKNRDLIAIAMEAGKSPHYARKEMKRIAREQADPLATMQGAVAFLMNNYESKTKSDRQYEITVAVAYAIIPALQQVFVKEKVRQVMRISSLSGALRAAESSELLICLFNNNTSCLFVDSRFTNERRYYVAGDQLVNNRYRVMALHGNEMPAKIAWFNDSTGVAVSDRMDYETEDGVLTGCFIVERFLGRGEVVYWVGDDVSALHIENSDGNIFDFTVIEYDFLRAPKYNLKPFIGCGEFTSWQLKGLKKALFEADDLSRTLAKAKPIPGAISEVMLEDGELSLYRVKVGDDNAVFCNALALYHRYLQRIIDEITLDLLFHIPNVSLKLECHSAVLTNDKFGEYLSLHGWALVALDLTNCNRLTGEILDKINRYCPHLKALVLDKCSWIKVFNLDALKRLQALEFLSLCECENMVVVAGDNNKGSIPLLKRILFNESTSLWKIKLALPNVESIALSELHNLQLLKISAPLLSTLLIEGCYELRSIRTNSSVLRELEVKDSHLSDKVLQGIVSAHCLPDRINIADNCGIRHAQFRSQYPFLFDLQLDDWSVDAVRALELKLLALLRSHNIDIHAANAQTKRLVKKIMVDLCAINRSARDNMSLLLKRYSPHDERAQMLHNGLISIGAELQQHSSEDGEIIELPEVSIVDKLKTLLSAGNSDAAQLMFCDGAGIDDETILEDVIPVLAATDAQVLAARIMQWILRARDGGFIKRVVARIDELLQDKVNDSLKLVNLLATVAEINDDVQIKDDIALILQGYKQNIVDNEDAIRDVYANVNQERAALLYFVGHSILYAQGSIEDNVGINDLLVGFCAFINDKAIFMMQNSFLYRYVSMVAQLASSELMQEQREIYLSKLYAATPVWRLHYACFVAELFVGDRLPKEVSSLFLRVVDANELRDIKLNTDMMHLLLCNLVRAENYTISFAGKRTHVGAEAALFAMSDCVFSKFIDVASYVGRFFEFIDPIFARDFAELIKPGDFVNDDCVGRKTFVLRDFACHYQALHGSEQRLPLVAVINYLRANLSVNVLDCSRVVFDDAEFELLRQFLIEQQSIARLIFDGCELTYNQSVKLRQVLQNNLLVHHISIADNEFGGPGVKEDLEDLIAIRQEVVKQQLFYDILCGNLSNKVKSVLRLGYNPNCTISVNEVIISRLLSLHEITNELYDFWARSADRANRNRVNNYKYLCDDAPLALHVLQYYDRKELLVYVFTDMDIDLDAAFKRFADFNYSVRRTVVRSRPKALIGLLPEQGRLAEIHAAPDDKARIKAHNNACASASFYLKLFDRKLPIQILFSLLDKKNYEFYRMHIDSVVESKLHTNICGILHPFIARHRRLDVAVVQKLLVAAVRQYNGAPENADVENATFNELASLLAHHNVVASQAEELKTYRYQFLIANISVSDGWLFEEYLSLQLRFLLSYIVRLTTNQMPCPVDKIRVDGFEEMIAKMSALIYRNIEALDVLHILHAIAKANIRSAQVRKRIYIALAEYLLRCVSCLQDSEFADYGIGFDKHASYLVFERRGNMIMMRVDDFGAGSIKHQGYEKRELVDRKLKAVRYAYPYIVSYKNVGFYTPKNRALVQYLANILQADAGGFADYFSSVYVETFRDSGIAALELILPATPCQTTGNCVVHNRQLILKQMLNVKGKGSDNRVSMYEWLQAELVTSFMQSTPDIGSADLALVQPNTEVLPKGNSYFPHSRVARAELNGEEICIKRGGDRKYGLTVEIDILRRCSALRIAPAFYNAVRNENALYMSYLPKGDLKNKILRDGDMAWDLRWKIACDLAAKLYILHQEKIVHRNLLPEHILLTNAVGRVNLCGFGSSRYMHQVWVDGGESKQMMQNDIYNYGCILAFMFTKCSDFVDVDTIRANINLQFPEHQAYADLIAQCLAAPKQADFNFHSVLNVLQQTVVGHEFFRDHALFAAYYNKRVAVDDSSVADSPASLLNELSMFARTRDDSSDLEGEQVCRESAATQNGLK